MMGCDESSTSPLLYQHHRCAETFYIEVHGCLLLQLVEFALGCVFPLSNSILLRMCRYFHVAGHCYLNLGLSMLSSLAGDVRLLGFDQELHSDVFNIMISCNCSVEICRRTNKNWRGRLIGCVFKWRWVILYRVMLLRNTAMWHSEMYMKMSLLLNTD